MYSCNAPVPSHVARLARGLATECYRATPRERHSISVKRLGDGRPDALARQLRETLSGTAPFEARVTGIDLFWHPPLGREPVAYLTVESPQFVAIHRALCTAFEPIEGLEMLEGDSYVPHITIARGGDADRLAGRDIEPITWTVEALSLWSADYDEVVERISLPV